MREILAEPFSTRVLIQILKQTRSRGTISLSTIASHARCSSDTTRRIVETLKLATENERLVVTPYDRLRLAHEACKAGLIGEAARMLSWREFESFTNQCFLDAGYDSRKNVRIQDGHGVREIDIVASRADLILCVDCKHWNSPPYLSRILPAARHQVAATKILLRNPIVTSKTPTHGLAIVLTLLRPGFTVKFGAVLVAAGQLPDFLTNLAGYSDHLPFISSEDALAENPIKEA